MNETTTTGRPNQRRRTRKDLLRAAARLMKQGRRPSLEEVAEEALVSRATAYRYFAGVDRLLVEAAVDLAVPEPNELFGEGSSENPVTRLEQVDETLQRSIVENEVPIRMMLAHSLERRVMRKETDDDPVRQNRRSALIETALRPARDEFDPTTLDKLTSALALVIGTEAMVVFRDVLQIDDEEAQEIKRWAIRALVAAAKKPTVSSS